MDEKDTVSVGRFMAFDTGCIECGESSALIGFFTTKASAEAACNSARNIQEEDWQGQHSFDVFDVTDIP